MDVKEMNRALSIGAVEEANLFPHLEDLKRSPHVFRMDFGLEALPEMPGLILVRGARQYGKSTWLEGQIRSTVEEFGPATAYYLNGDGIRDSTELQRAVRELAPLFRPDARVRRLFIDEVTAIADWQSGLKQVLDAGELRDVLVVTTGSKATDLRRGGERLPGRKGSLDRTTYIFTPVPYAEFKRACGVHLGKETLPAYLLSGGSPLACAQLARHRKLPEFVLEATRDWIYGECAFSGRSRPSLLAIIELLMKFGASPVSQAKLARETGLANNTVAAGYLDLLGDLLCLGTAHAWDESRRVRLPRRPSKHPFINILAAIAWHPFRLRSIEDLEKAAPEIKGCLAEWLVAQEIWRRRARKGEELPELLAYWQSKEHEVDFVLAPDELLEVKVGKATPIDFAWFPRAFPRGRLKVISSQRFRTERITGVTLEDFLLDD